MATCEQNGHIYGVGGVCVFCGARKASGVDGGTLAQPETDMPATQDLSSSSGGEEPAAAAGSPPTAQERKVCEVCHEPCHHEGRACTCKDALRALIEKAQRFLAWEESPEFQACPRCDGKGYHHGFGDGGVDPDWCTSCGGPGQVPTEPGCWAAEDILAEFVEALLRQESSTT